MATLSLKHDFPVLSRRVSGKPLAYLDSAASSQMPKQVIAAISDYQSNHHANVHRGVHVLSEEATEAYESSRKTIAKFINAKPEEIVFVRNATEAINLVARAWGDANVAKGDSILLTQLEHHANIVPWQQLAQRRNAKLHYARMATGYLLDENDFSEKLHKNNPQVASFTAASNALGAKINAKKLAGLAKRAGALSVVDACQLAPHEPIDVQSIGCDFLAFSGHKLLGPTGIGVLYGRRELLEETPPFLGGGDMIRTVSWQGFTPNDVPHKFEAGTPNISGAVGLAAALGYINKIGFGRIKRHEHSLLKLMLDELGSVHGLEFYGPGTEARVPLASFNVAGVHSHDVASILDSEGVAIRAGHHCAQPLMSVLNVPSTCRASLALYNDERDVAALSRGLAKVRRVFG